MPLVFFMAPTDPRMLSTNDALNRSPANGGLVSSDLVYRYDVSRGFDGLPGEKGTFNICSFWLLADGKPGSPENPTGFQGVAGLHQHPQESVSSG